MPDIKAEDISRSGAGDPAANVFDKRGPQERVYSQVPVNKTELRLLDFDNSQVSASMLRVWCKNVNWRYAKGDPNTTITLASGGA